MKIHSVPHSTMLQIIHVRSIQRKVKQKHLKTCLPIRKHRIAALYQELRHYTCVERVRLPVNASLTTKAPVTTCR